MKALLGLNVDLNSGVATRVVDVASVNLGDRHGESVDGFDVSFCYLLIRRVRTRQPLS